MTEQLERENPDAQADSSARGRRGDVLRVDVEGLRLAAGVHGDVFEVRLAGDLDFATTRQRVSGPLLDLYRATSVRDIVVDLSEVTFLDSGGLSFLVRLRAAAVARGGRVSLRGPSAHSSRVLILSGVMQLFPDTMDASAPVG